MTWYDMVRNIEVAPILERKIVEYLKTFDEAYLTAEFSEYLFAGELIRSRRTGELVRPHAMITSPADQEKILEAVYQELERGQTDK